MSPCASDSLISTDVTAERCSTAPPSSSGTPVMVRPSSLACESSSGGVALSASAASAAGRSLSRPKSRTDSRSMCCSSLGVRSKRSLRLARGWRAGRESFCAAANVRPACAAVRAVVFDASWRNFSAGSRSPIRSSRSDAARRFRARSPTAMLLSVKFCCVATYVRYTNRCDVKRCNAADIWAHASSYIVLTRHSSSSRGDPDCGDPVDARADRRGRAPAC